MSTADRTAPCPDDATPLRGDVCPPWCGGIHHVERVHKGVPLHVEDQCVQHQSDRFDAFGRREAGRTSTMPSAYVEARVYDHAGDPVDGPFVYAEYLDQHSGQPVLLGMPVVEAQLLAEAMLQAVRHAGDAR